MERGTGNGSNGDRGLDYPEPVDPIEDRSKRDPLEILIPGSSVVLKE